MSDTSERKLSRAHKELRRPDEFGRGPTSEPFYAFAWWPVHAHQVDEDKNFQRCGHSCGTHEPCPTMSLRFSICSTVSLIDSSEAGLGDL